MQAIKDWAEAQRAASNRKSKRAEKAKTLWPQKVKRSKAKSNKDIEATRWQLFSTWVRNRAARDQDGLCFTCDSRPLQDAGHMISRRRRATKYHPQNVFGQCKFCNWSDKFQPGHHDKHVMVFIAKRGLQTYNDLVALSRTTLQESRADIIAHTEAIKAKIESGDYA